MNTFGNLLKVTLFGESHGACVGCTIDGLPSGFAPDLSEVDTELARRIPDPSVGGTSRREADRYEILSGLYRGKLTGAPLTVVFSNTDVRSEDYPPFLCRPSHADLTAYIKYSGHNDPRGGGMFSGRMTLPLVFAGSIVKQLLKKLGVFVFSHIYSIGGIHDAAFDPVSRVLPAVDPLFPLIDPAVRVPMEALLSRTRENGDSVGGAVECVISGLAAGIGEPFFGSVESHISHMLFSVPGIHGVEFGDGFGLCAMLGSEANDNYQDGGQTVTNHSGGINGGITNGMPVVFRACFRPVPSISKKQDFIDPESLLAVSGSVKGRHDACILPRGCAAVEAAAAIAVYDLILERRCRE